MISATANSSFWLGEDQVSGFMGLGGEDGLFYWLFRSRSNKSQDPLIIWFSGPLCSTVFSVFTGVGPYKIGSNSTLSINLYSWNTNANLLFFEEPTDIYTYVYLFLEKFPEFKGRPMYIAGDAYAGHYLAQLSDDLLMRNNSDMNLVGIALGNGWINPSIQYPSIADYAKQSSLVGFIGYQTSKTAYSLCKSIIDSKNWPLAYIQCSKTTDLLMETYNKYDKRQK